MARKKINVQKSIDILRVGWKSLKMKRDLFKVVIKEISKVFPI